MRVLLHTGKGGVGKTSLAVATALSAARHGHRVCLLSTDAAHSVGDALGRAVGPDPVAVAPGVVAQEVSALAELERSWAEIRAWLCALLHDDSDPLVAEEVLALPGLEELVSLRAVREAERSGDFDVCVVDCAPTGSTLRLLRLPDALRWFMDHFFEAKRGAMRLVRPVAERLGVGRFVAPDEVFEAVDALYRDILEVREILLDVDRTSARLVVNPARVVVDETRRSLAYLSLYGVATDAVLVNRVLPDGLADGYFRGWVAREREELDEIARSFPLPTFRAPLRPSEPIGVEALRSLADDLFADRDPAAFFTRVPPVQIEKRDGRTTLCIALPGVSGDDVGVAVRGHDLLVDVRDAQRRVALPASVVGRRVESARLEKGVLEIRFGEAPR